MLTQVLEGLPSELWENPRARTASVEVGKAQKEGAPLCLLPLDFQSLSPEASIS